jgi:hypothetical protein
MLSQTLVLEWESVLPTYNIHECKCGIVNLQFYTDVWWKDFKFAEVNNV